MSTLNTDLNNTKNKYREIFLKTNEELLHQVEKIKPLNACQNCSQKDCDKGNDFLSKFPADCELKLWQENVLKMFNDEISIDAINKLKKILDYRNSFKCTNCATCCKLACSEFSPDELKIKAQNGDNFAKQFTSIFIPYESDEIPKSIYPEYFEVLQEKFKDEKVYFYHCPKVTDGNKCSDYENRPQICRDFPDNPLSILPKACGYSKWKEEVETMSLMLHALLEITDFYRQKIMDNSQL